MNGERLKGKVTIVTGGAHGIGRAFCLGFAHEGSRVVVSDVDGGGAQAVAREIKALGGEAIPIEMDVSIPEDAMTMAEKTIEQFGRIDVLINNAAIFARVKITQAPFYEITPDDWDRVMAVNLKGPFLCTRAVFPYMKAQMSGKIINISSGTFFKGADVFVHYVVSKGGVIGLTRSISNTLGQYHININCIAPGRTFSEEPDDSVALKTCERKVAGRSIKRLEYPEDLVGTAIFLASPDSDYITGQTIVVDGGDVKH